MHRQRASSATCSIRGHVSWRISRFLGSRQLVHLKVTVHSGGETKYLPILIHRMRETKQNKNSRKKPSPNPGAVPFWLSPGSGRSREARAAGRAEAALAGAVGGEAVGSQALLSEAPRLNKGHRGVDVGPQWRLGGGVCLLWFGLDR